MGGAEHSLLLLLRHLDPERFRPVLACTEGPLAVAARRAGHDVRTIGMPKIRGKSSAARDLPAGVLALATIARQARARIVHSNVMRASFYAAGAARLTGRPLVWHVRDIHRESWYLRFMCALSRRAIAISEAVAAPIPCRYLVRVVPNGLDLAPYASADGARFRTDIGVRDAEVLIGIVGRIWPWKGQQTFLDAAAHIAPEYPNARFAVMGDVLFPSDHDFLADLKTQATRLGLGDRVIFTGHRADIPDVMAGLDILVQASDAEPFGRVLIEAMAAARPVAAFRDGGVPEIVVDGETGLLVPAGDVPGLAAAMAALAADPARRVALGAAGRQRVEQHFTAEQTARGVEAVYAEILAGIASR